MHGGVGAGDAARHGDHQANGKLGDGDGVGAGGVHDDDAGVGGGVDVDVVDAHAGAADGAQFGRGLKQLGVDLHGGANDQRVCVCEFGFESAGTELGDRIGGDDVPAGLFLEDGEGCGRDFFCKNDLHGASSVTG